MCCYLIYPYMYNVWKHFVSLNWHFYLLEIQTTILLIRLWCMRSWSRALSSQLQRQQAQETRSVVPLFIHSYSEVSVEQRRETNLRFLCRPDLAGGASSSPSQGDKLLCLFVCCTMSCRIAQPVKWRATIGFRFSIGCVGVLFIPPRPQLLWGPPCLLSAFSLHRANAYPSVTLMRRVLPLSPYSSCRDAWQQW